MVGADMFGAMAQALVENNKQPAHPVRVCDLRPSGDKTRNTRTNKPVPSVLACVLQCLVVRSCTITEIAHATDTAYSRVREALHTLQTWGWAKQLHGQGPRLHKRARPADQWLLIWPDPFDDEDIEEDDE